MKRRSLDEPAYDDFLALRQFLPGPASNQMVFALGMREQIEFIAPTDAKDQPEDTWPV